MKRLVVAFMLMLAAISAQASVAMHVASRSFEIGSRSFFYCFLSTVSANLEPSGWGSRFPVLIKKLHRGTVSPSDLPQLNHELSTIRIELKKYPPSRVVWNFEHREIRPPWGDKISEQITDLSNYFVTSDGKDLFEAFSSAIEEAERAKSSINVE